MRIALVATPFTDHNLQLASQIGVTDIVIRYPGCRPRRHRAALPTGHATRYEDLGCRGLSTH